MKKEKLTEKILASLDPTTILYAEYAEPGAPGRSNTVYIYTFSAGNLYCYYTEPSDSTADDSAPELATNKPTATEPAPDQPKRRGRKPKAPKPATLNNIYFKSHDYLQDLSKKGQLLIDHDPIDSHHAYKSKSAVFTRDDDECTLIFTHKDTEFPIPVVTPKVYFGIVAEFAERPISIKKLTKFLKKFYRTASREENAFFSAYLNQIRRNDTGDPDFGLTVNDYWCAIKYIRFLSHEYFNLSDEQIYEGLSALSKYRLRLVVEKIGWRNLDEFFYNFITEDQKLLFIELDKVVTEITMNPLQAEALAESASASPSEAVLRAHNIKANKKRKRYFRYHRAKIISNRDNALAIKSHSAFKLASTFTEITYFSSGHTDLSLSSENCITNLFSYPVIVKFTDVAHRKITSAIMKSSSHHLCQSAEALSYYLANYILNEDTLSYADILPAASHIIETLPFADPYKTGTPHLFWLAGAIVDRAWVCLERTPEAEQKFNDFVYGLYAPRIGGLWPIVHYNEFTFKDPAADTMFNEALGFLLMLSNISDLNPDLKRYLDAYTDGINYPLSIVKDRAIREYCNKLTPEEKFSEILKVCDPNDYSSFLDCPESNKEADILLTELFRTDRTAHLNGFIRLSILEQLIITPNRAEVGEHILDYLVKHFDDFISVIEQDSKLTELDFFDILVTLFTAAASGITEENEFPPLTAFADKIRKLSIERATEQSLDSTDSLGVSILINPVDTALDDAMRYARKHRRTILFQRSALQQLF